MSWLLTWRHGSIQVVFQSLLISDNEETQTPRLDPVSSFWGGPPSLPLTLSPSCRSAPVVWSMKKHSNRSTLSFSLMEVSLILKRSFPAPSLVSSLFLPPSSCFLLSPPPQVQGQLRVRFSSLITRYGEERLIKQYHEVS